MSFFRERQHVDAVLLIGSCTRGQGFRDIDFAVLTPPDGPPELQAGLQREWSAFERADPTIQAVRNLGDFGRVDMDFIDGAFGPDERGWTSGPSEYELEVGNYIAYSVPLFERNDRYARLRDELLPYSSEELAQSRLAETRKYCLNNLSHVHTFVERAIYFQAFHRLYDAFREFIQALFISRRTYPIADDKWIREQVEEMLGLPDLYVQLRAILEVSAIESAQTAERATTLQRLLEEHTS